MTQDQLWDFYNPITDLGLNVPRWIDQDITGVTIAAIYQGGCDSGAYLPAVTYREAYEIMGAHGDDVLQYLEDYGDELPEIPAGRGWRGVSVHFLSCAVELWAYVILSEIEDVPWVDLHDLQAMWDEIRAELPDDDEPAINEAFNNWTDALCKDGEICQWQYDNLTTGEGGREIFLG